MAVYYTACEVSKHKSIEDGVWVVINNKVYDVTELCRIHPTTSADGQRESLVIRLVRKSQYQNNLIIMHPTKINNKMKKYQIGKLIHCKEEGCVECETHKKNQQ